MDLAGAALSPPVVRQFDFAVVETAAQVAVTCLMYRRRQPAWSFLRLRRVHDANEREVRDLPSMEFRTAVVVEVYGVCCPGGGNQDEKMPQLPSKAPFSERFEDAVGAGPHERLAPARQSRGSGLPASTVRAIDL